MAFADRFTDPSQRAVEWDGLRRLFDFGLMLGWEVLEPEWDRRIRLLLVAALRSVWDMLNEDCRIAIDLNERYADSRDSDQLQMLSRAEPPALAESLEEQELAWRVYETLDQDLVEDRKFPLWPRILEALATRQPAGNFMPTAEQFHFCLFHDIVRNPFRPVAFDPAWRTTDAVALASSMYESRDFAAMPILADALQDAGCNLPEILDHCRGPGPHVRGCWVVDLVLERT